MCGWRRRLLTVVDGVMVVAQALNRYFFTPAIRRDQTARPPENPPTVLLAVVRDRQHDRNRLLLSGSWRPRPFWSSSINNAGAPVEESSPHPLRWRLSESHGSVAQPVWAIEGASSSSSTRSAPLRMLTQHHPDAVCSWGAVCIGFFKPLARDRRRVWVPPVSGTALYAHTASSTRFHFSVALAAPRQRFAHLLAATVPGYCLQQLIDERDVASSNCCFARNLS